MRPQIDFSNIRAYGPLGSKADGFEELVSELIVSGALVQWPPGTRFERFGNPDGGREGRGVLPTGDVHAWQAKYLFRIDASALGQITDSVRRVITTEPKLTRLYLALPYDRPAGDRDDRQSAHTRWADKVKEWEQLALERGMTVEFIYTGASEITSALTAPSQAGRLRYWFDATVLTLDWMQTVVERAVADAGPRYTPELHVDLPIARVLDGLGRTHAFGREVRRRLADLREARDLGWWLPHETSDAVAVAFDAATVALDRVDAALGDAVAASTSVDPLPSELPRLTEGAFTAMNTLESVLYEHCLPAGSNFFTGTAGSLYSALRRATSAIEGVRSLVTGPAWSSVTSRVLLLTGDGGTGKTHLLCDAANRRIAEGAPTLLVLGSWFGDGPPLAQLVEQVGFDGNGNEVLATLDAAAEAAGTVGLVIIDAINEAGEPRRWTEHLAGLAQDVTRHPHLALAVSCRTQYEDLIVPEAFRARAARAVHAGFAEAPLEAVGRYISAYGIERPSFPMLEPEFMNPLLLKLLCTTLRERGETRFPRGGLSISWLFDAYLDAVDARLAVPERCDFDPRDRLVHVAVSRLADALAAAEARWLPRTAAREIVDGLLPNRDWSRSLLKGVLDEGVLTATSARGEERVVFGYERLGDATAARRIATRPKSAVAASVRGLAAAWWRNAGLLDALAIVVPEAHGFEVADVIEELYGELPHAAQRSFLAGLIWRAHDSIGDHAIERLVELTRDPDAEAFATLLRVATVPGHPLNAEWLHAFLTKMPPPERDAVWTAWTSHTDDLAPSALIDWAWSTESGTADSEVRHLAGLALGWLLASSNRPARDRATKALVSLLEGHPPVVAKVLDAFADVDDPYVAERLFAVMCGITARSRDAAEQTLVGSRVAGLVEGRWPEHLLTRDYARRAIRAAIDAGWRSPPGLAQRIDPPYDSEWPTATRTAEEVEELRGPPDYPFSSVSVGEMSDFRHYTIRHVLDRLSDLPDDAEAVVSRRVFDRVLELGWTPERFRDLDRGRSWEPSAGRTVERVGKKYQWIALFETLGRLADHHQVGGQYTDDPVRCYDDPAELDARDIDPTNTLPDGGGTAWADTAPAWWIPQPAQFDARPHDQWIRDAGGIPDPLDLISVDGGAHGRWLNLEAYYRWSEPMEADERALKQLYRHVRLSIQAYLVSDGEQVADWATANLWTADMPESPQIHGTLLHDHPGHQTWRFAVGNIDFWRDPPPFDIEYATARYTGVASNDRSAQRGANLLPSGRLIELLQLERADDLSWTSRHTGRPACFDATATVSGAAALLTTPDAITELAGTGRTLLFEVRAQKDIHTPGHFYDTRDHDVWWVEGRAFYLLDSGAVRLVAAEARSMRRGPIVSADVDWPVSGNRSL